MLPAESETLFTVNVKSDAPAVAVSVVSKAFNKFVSCAVVLS